MPKEGPGGGMVQDLATGHRAPGADGVVRTLLEEKAALDGLGRSKESEDSGEEATAAVLGAASEPPWPQKRLGLARGSRGATLARPRGGKARSRGSWHSPGGLRHRPVPMGAALV